MMSFKRDEKENFLDDEIRLRWSLELFEGLSYMHSMNVVHLDLKPENIYLFTNKSGKIILKIGYFGLNKEIISYFRLFVGSFWYQSPQIATGKTYSIKTDVWLIFFFQILQCFLRFLRVTVTVTKLCHKISFPKR